jgi:calcineurin-like phosphoesterase family protein
LISILRHLLLVLVIMSPVALADDWRVDDADRVVAIADIHGAYEAMVETLTNVGILDDELAWAGGTTHLVIVGDLVDRGPRSRDVMDLLMSIEDGAVAAGGYVHVLFGNHESMNMIGDMRYVSKAEYAAFAADETQEQRDRWFKPWTKREGGKKSDSQARYDDAFPPGFFALREAFGPEGKYGKWLLDKAVIAVVNGTAFVHGGLSPLVAEIGLDGVNQGLKSDLAEYVTAVDLLMSDEVLLPTDSYFDHDAIVKRYAPFLVESKEARDALKVVKELGESAVFTRDGPLWYRGNIACSGIIEEQRLDATLQAIGAKRVVVGHTPTPGRRVLERFDGGLIEVDTGMLNNYYKGSGNALVIENGELLVFNQSGADPYAPIAHPRRVGWRPGNLSADELQLLLETGEIVSQSKDKETGRSMVQVSDGTNTVSAIFSKRQGKGFYPNVAAYRLDRLLGLDMVPVTTLRTVKKTEGSLQFLPEKVSDEAQRSESGLGSGARCSLPWQWEAMYVFDVLIYNEGRSLHRMLYDPSQWSLILIEHERAFKNAKGRPSHLKNAPVSVSDGWRVALAELSDDELAAQFSDVLDKRRLKALAARRDQLLAM